MINNYEDSLACKIGLPHFVPSTYVYVYGMIIEKCFFICFLFSEPHTKLTFTPSTYATCK